PRPPRDLRLLRMGRRTPSSAFPVTRSGLDRHLVGPISRSLPGRPLVPTSPATYAVIPACNESDGIAAAVRGLRTQTVPPDEVVVVANNCVDDTAERAAAAGATVLAMPVNRDRKAGALNWALASLLPRLAPGDRVLV